MFNQYFCSVYTVEDQTNLPTIIDLNYTTGLSDIQIDQIDILNRLKLLDKNKAMGPNNLHPNVLKELPAELSAPLTKIFQMSINLGQIPEA